MKYPKLRELKEAFTSLFSSPYTTKFPKVPSPAAPAYRGKAEFNEEECVVCGACANVCPPGAIEKIEGRAPDGKRKLVLHYDRCIFCGQCEANCLTEKGIKLTTKYDLAVLSRSEAQTSIEDELIFCEYCGEPITTKKHLAWVRDRLGSLAFSNPNLFMSSLMDLELVREKLPPKEEGAPLERADNLRILCPRCRKQLTLKEEWGQSLKG
ncbi:MAG TPA: 4Fe-4S dicluster domain-containing protein [Candidatus Aerophobetes bacterium]|uniref:4Fe-4S dicluster domain-containing protein n=1 Tax=Aerophobetes bacterium TaxID=2030807 RepID=A0A7V5HZ10_UNCAE|nr:4Fe-4S dicluster domain-containing protein [Candidatus Aerophobetes bacterium]